MNADGSANVSSEVSIGARIPHLLAIGIAAVAVGSLLMVASGVGIQFAMRGRNP